MRVAIPHWQGRISPVLDTAAEILLVDVEDGVPTRRELRGLVAADVLGRAGELSDSGADVVLCGAVSAPLAAALACAGIKVVAFLCGPVEEVLAAWLAGGLDEGLFWMPGRRRWVRRRRWRCAMAETMGGGCRQGGGAGRHGKGGCTGKGGPRAGGPAAECVCPNCGERAPHTPGQPCRQMKCPKCGAAMTRA